MKKEMRINFRVSEYEMKLLQSKAKRAKMKLSEFCRRAVFGKEIVHIEGLSDCVYELNKIGTNVNQITIAANQGHDVTRAMAVIKSRLCQIFDTINNVLTGGGSDSDCQTD